MHTAAELMITILKILLTIYRPVFVNSVLVCLTLIQRCHENVKHQCFKPQWNF